MPNAVTVSAVLSMLALAPLAIGQQPDEPPPPPAPLFSPDQIDNLLAPVALYPDPLLAQILLAATFPDQVDEAARFVRADTNPDDIDGQAWDVSVKAVAHYPTVLFMMADQLDWTASLGQAYVGQPDDVMASIQRLRAEAQASGNLQSDADMQLVGDNGDIEIWPAQAQQIFVPEYDPGLVYFGSGAISFGSGFLIGPWLNHDFNWRTHVIYYHGWTGAGWITRSWPYMRPTSVYVNNQFRNVVVDRTVLNRNINYGNLDRFATVHPNVTYSGVPATNNIGEHNNSTVANKIIERNVNTNDPRINEYRGSAGRQEQRPAPSAFGGNQGAFTARESSARGQASRQEMQRSAPAPRPAPAPAPHASGGGGKRR